MGKPEIPGDYQFWRDYPWDKYLESELPKHPTKLEQQELKDAVHIVREYSRVFSENNVSREDIRLIMDLEKGTSKHTFAIAIALLAQISGIYYKGKRQGDDKLDFAITAIAKATQRCKEKQFDKVLPILTRFAKELGNE